jgi:hypothetical protein
MREHPVSVVVSWLSATLMGLAASSASAASFNCQRATLPAEKAICGDATSAVSMNGRQECISCLPRFVSVRSRLDGLN